MSKKEQKENTSNAFFFVNTTHLIKSHTDAIRSLCLSLRCIACNLQHYKIDIM